MINYRKNLSELTKQAFLFFGKTSNRMQSNDQGGNQDSGSVCLVSKRGNL